MWLEGSNPSAALEWVREDLEKQFRQIRSQLEEAAEANDDAVLQETRDSLGQLGLTFQTLQQTGADMVTTEMAALCDMLVDGSADDRDNAYAALMDALVVLPSYLDRLQAGHPDLPILLLPTLNELRAAQNNSLFSEGMLFAPELSVDIPELEETAVKKLSKGKLSKFINKTRNQFENALLNWLNDQEDGTLLEPLRSICDLLHRSLSHAPQCRLWWITSSVISGQIEGSVENDLPLRRIFARLDLVLKELAGSSDESSADTEAEALSRALLFQAAQAAPGDPVIDQLKQLFKLDELIPDREDLMRAKGAITGRNRELFESVSIAVKEELVQIKDALDLELRTGKVDEERHQQAVDELNQLSDTLKILGLTAPAEAMQELVTPLQNITSIPEDEREAVLLGLAQQLLRTESILDEHIETLGAPVPDEKDDGYIELPHFEQRQIHHQLLNECVSTLREMQERIRERLGGETQAEFESGFEQITGALALLGKTEVSQLSQQLHQSLNIIFEEDEPAESEQLEQAADAVAALELFLTSSRDHQASSETFLETLKQRLQDLPGAEVPEAEEEQAEEEAEREAPELHVVQTEDAGQDTEDTTESEEQDESTEDQVEGTAAEPSSGIDPEIQKIFLEEFDAVYEELTQQLPAWLAAPADMGLLTELRRGFHTLKGSGRMVGAHELGEYSWEVESLLNQVLDNQLQATDQLQSFVTVATAALPGIKQRLLEEESFLSKAAIEGIKSTAIGLSENNESALDELATLLPEQLSSLIPGTSQQAEDEPEADRDTDETLLQLMRSELRQHLQTLEAFADRLSENATTIVDDEPIRSVHTIAGTLAMQPDNKGISLAHSLEHLLQLQKELEQPLPDDGIAALNESVASFRARLAALEGGELSAPPSPDELVARLKVASQMMESLSDPQVEDTVTEEAPQEAQTKEQQPEEVQADSETSEEVTAEEPATEETVAVEATEEEAEVETAEEESAEEETAEQEGAEEESDEAEEEPEDVPEAASKSIQNIFLEEATEVLERTDTQLNDWRDKLDDFSIARGLLRDLHTFKGGARMASLDSLGELSHAMESLLERVVADRLKPSAAVVHALEEGCDRLHEGVEQLLNKQELNIGDALQRFEQRVESLASIVAPVADKPIETLEEEVKEFRDIPEEQAAEPTDEGPAQTQVRVSADLLDDLVNFSGEISIYRSRLEQQITTFRFNLTEIDQTIARLRDQLRKLEIETEAQILSRYQREGLEGEVQDFDPLELDRFSTMQQLSRALAESVSDLLNLQEMLDDTARQSETLLLQQSRVNTELQEGLMQTRMVPFGSIAARLRRVVRGAAADTKKQARLQLRMAGSSDLLDRNVLERITVPLEHMLRNAVVHGVETPKERRKRKKPAEGTITLTVEAEATEFIIRLQDDGNGIDLGAIKKRAIERGLLKKNDRPSKQQLLEFILESGFSTASTLTELAGRGVGMDVVNSEIKQIGGSVDIASAPRKGTRFTVRIPFSLAVMQAIGVTAGDRQYMIPLANVRGVARMLPADYADLAATENPVYEFAGETYPVLELEPLLGATPQPIGSENVSLLMIRAGDQLAAFHVPQLMGHREIVIKPVGPQVSSIPGILGGTITGDGQVVIILDMGPMIRRGVSEAEEAAEAVVAAPELKRQPLVMVVDDSITMRKVTSRVLENHSLEVITAKDGLDAIEQMQERVPDLMLLDIEMPRMDGYELAEYVRNDQRLKDFPIMMITSRSGQKHRDRAREVGANDYMTKPYQENELINRVYELLGMEPQ